MKMEIILPSQTLPLIKYVIFRRISYELQFVIKSQITVVLLKGNGCDSKQNNKEY